MALQMAVRLGVDEPLGRHLAASGRSTVSGGQSFTTCVEVPADARLRPRIHFAYRLATGVREHKIVKFARLLGIVVAASQAIAFEYVICPRLRLEAGMVGTASSEPRVRKPMQEAEFGVAQLLGG